MKTDIEIAQSCTLLPITAIGAKLGLTEEQLECYGRYKAKLLPSAFLQRHVPQVGIRGKIRIPLPEEEIRILSSPGRVFPLRFRRQGHFFSGFPGKPAAKFHGPGPRHPDVMFGTRHVFRSCCGFANSTPTSLAPGFPFPDSIPCLCPHSSVYMRYRNFNLLSIDYVFRPRLRSRLTQSRSALLWKP